MDSGSADIDHSRTSTVDNVPAARRGVRRSTCTIRAYDGQ
jgi:hypothetical protein